jgi:hypothetical protein
VNIEDDFLLCLSETSLKQQMLKAIDNYINSTSTTGHAKQEVVDEIVTELILHGKFAGTIG